MADRFIRLAVFSCSFLALTIGPVFIRIIPWKKEEEKSYREEIDIMDETRNVNPQNHKKKYNNSRQKYRHQKHKDQSPTEGTNVKTAAESSPVVPTVSVAERIQSIERKSPVALANGSDPVVSFRSNNYRKFGNKSPTNRPFEPTSAPSPSKDAMAVTCEDFIKHPIQETTKVATKIVSQLTEIQTEMTFRSISNKTTWSDALISDNMNDEKDLKKSSSSNSSVSSSLLGHLIMAVCKIIKEISIILLGRCTVTSLEQNMSPLPNADAR